MSTYLGNYVNENINNPELSLSDVINDEEFIDELQRKNIDFIEFLIKHFDEILNLVTEDPDPNSDYKRIYKYPFISSEILCCDNELIRNKILNNEDGKCPLIRLFKYFIIKNENESILPGYIEKIIRSIIDKNPNEVKCLLLENNEILESLYDLIDNDSISEIFFNILKLDILFIYKLYEYFKKIIMNIDINIEKVKNIIVIYIKIMKTENDKVFINKLFDIIIDVLNLLIIIINNYNDIQIKKVNHYILLFISNLLTNFVNDKEILKSLNFYYFEDYNQKTQTVANDNLNENFNTNNIESNKDKIDFPEDFKNKVIDYMTQNYVSLFILAENLKELSRSENINTLHKNNKIKKISESYIIFLDITIIIIQFHNINIKNILIGNPNIIDTFLYNILKYPNNSFLNLKTLKIMEYLLFSDFYIELKDNLISSFISFLKNLPCNYLQEVINIEKNCLNYKSLSSLNCTYIMKILQFFYFYTQRHHFKDSMLIQIEDYILAYINIISKDLLSKEIQSSEDIKNAGDEEMKMNEKNFYDSEAFLFTTKRIIENSRKLNQKLKKLDI